MKGDMIRSLLAASLAALALVAGSCGGSEESEPVPPAAPAPAESEPPPESEPGETAPPPVTAPEETEPPAGTTTLSVYFLREDRIGVGHRQVPETEAVGAAALEQLLLGPSEFDVAAGLGSEIPQGTSLNGLTIEDGIATVDLSGEFESGGGSLGMFARLAQIVFTLTQFPTVEGVLLELDGVPVETFSSEGIVLEGPQTRDDYEDLAPAILVESPAPGDTVSSPVTISGSANVFEANVSLAIEDAAGNEIASDFTTATCGTGCRGTFETSVPFEWEGEPSGTVIVYEASAKDGSRINVVEIPVAFE
jgi:hypothetical protein